MKIPVSEQCGIPGCHRSRGADIHGRVFGCKKCAREGGHVHWRSYLSVAWEKPRLSHHVWASKFITVTTPPPMDGVERYLD